MELTPLVILENALILNSLKVLFYLGRVKIANVLFVKWSENLWHRSILLFVSFYSLFCF